MILRTDITCTATLGTLDAFEAPVETHWYEGVGGLLARLNQSSIQGGVTLDRLSTEYLSTLSKVRSTSQRAGVR